MKYAHKDTLYCNNLKITLNAPFIFLETEMLLHILTGLQMLNLTQAKRAEGLSLVETRPACPSVLWNATHPSCGSNHNIATHSITVGSSKRIHADMSLSERRNKWLAPGLRGGSTRLCLCAVCCYTCLEFQFVVFTGPGAPQSHVRAEADNNKKSLDFIFSRGTRTWISPVLRTTSLVTYTDVMTFCHAK